MENNNQTKEFMLEEVISSVVKIPGVKVNRKVLLTELFHKEDSNTISEIIEKGPVDAGIDKDTLSKISEKHIIKRTSQSSVASFVAGIPGGLAMAATIPADILQFFGMALRLAQELSYIYGAEDLWEDGEIDEEKVKNTLVLYCGVMFGVSGAVSGVRVLSTQIAKTTLKKLPQKALTKTLWYPIVKKIGRIIGVQVTKKSVASGVSKVIPIIGGVISGTLNFVSMKPMASRLKTTFENAKFDYSDEKFNKDIDVLLSVDENANNDEADKESSSEKVTGFDKLKKGVGGLFSKQKKEEINVQEKKNDPYEEIKNMKELLDMGIITQEEFDQKKKDLLDL